VVAFVQAAQRRAGQWLTRPVCWPAVGLLAEELQRRERLSGAEVGKMWRRAEAAALAGSLERLRAAVAEVRAGQPDGRRALEGADG
jgi:hypothetical protein